MKASIQNRRCNTILNKKLCPIFFQYGNIDKAHNQVCVKAVADVPYSIANDMGWMGLSL